MNFLFTITDSYAPFCGVTIQSIIENNKDLDLNFYIVCPDIKEVNKIKLGGVNSDDLKQKITVTFVELSEPQQKLIADVGRYLPCSHNTTFLLRLLAEQLLPDHIKTVLYMDVDIIVNSSLVELENYEFSESIGAAVVKDVTREDDYRRLSIDRNIHSYFNAGVMLINLEYWRANSVGHRCLMEICKDKEVSFMPDQDALNIILQGKVDYLHPRYNCLMLFYMRDEYLRYRVAASDFLSVKEAAANPAIIHYVFQNKPWFKCGYLPKKDLWYHYLALTEWADYKPVWRNGYKGFLSHYLKSAVETAGLLLGFEVRPNLFRKRRFKHIQVLFLFLYYFIAQWLPNFDSPFFGKLSNKFRVFCVKRLFDYVGRGVNIGRRAHFGVGSNVRIGNNSNIGAHCRVPSNIVIEDDVMMGPNNFFFCSFTHDVSDVHRPMVRQGFKILNGKTIIHSDVWIGMDCLFMPNIEVGSHSIIGARTVVTKRVPEYVVFAGNPGKVMKSRG